ncbi:hypothetical protein [uncultured Pelagimonas sp.]|uniref:hypothetical protein n=1 Tax=uncultured Pelagimonas sp. TaxID=1618102 RepID=UPI002612B2CD|nr:hypothetical protein [uncultured Pelagimonas sp.]
MTLTWTSLPSTQADPMGDWLAQTQEERGSTGWRPRIIYTQPGVSGAKTAADMQSFFATQSGYKVTDHDLAHWLYADQNAGKDGYETGPNELIVFEKVDCPSFELPAALQAHLGGDDASAISGSRLGETAQGVAAAQTTTSFGLQPRTLGEREQTKGAQTDGDPLVVTAIIDHAIPFAHARFRHGRAHSRLDAVWLQGRGNEGASACEVVIGRQIAGAEIDAFLGRIGGDLDSEAAVYSEIANPAGASWRAGNRPLAQSYCHGGMMLDIAAGRDIDDPKATRHRILAVELPPQLVAQTNGFMHEIYVKSAMNWVWHAARQLYANVPHEVLLNYSFGDHSGRHDGQGLLDADFQLRLDRNEFAAVTVSAGNSFQADCHAELTSDDIVQRQELYLCLQPDDKTASFVQFWLEGDCPDLPFEFDVAPPTTIGYEPPPAPLSQDGELQDMADPSAAIARIYVQRDLPDYALPVGMSGKARTRVTLAIRPTASDDPTALVAPAGRWRLVFGPKHGATLSSEERVMLWVERGDSLAGFPARGRQAYLDHPSHQRRLENGRLDEALSIAGNPIKRRNTMSSNACAAGALVAAAARGPSSDAMAAYSSAGAGADVPGDEPIGPLVALEVELSDARRSMLAAGTGSGTVRLANGTSAATANLSRKLADAILDGLAEASGASSKPDLRTYAVSLATRGAELDPARAGAGRVPSGAAREVLRQEN